MKHLVTTINANTTDSDNFNVLPESNIQEQVAIIYQQASYLLLILLLISLIIFWVYYRKLQNKKAEQAKVEHALAVAESQKQAAEKSAKAKLSFLARMSHEIRTPMNGIFGMAEALSFTELNPEQQELLGTLKGSASNLLALLNDVLDFSKMDAGKLTLELVPVNLHQLTQNLINTFSHPENAKKLTFNLQVDEEITHSYFTDPTRLTQVFNNLLSNAVKFTRQGNIDITIALLTRQITEKSTYDTLKISVTDTGIGIAENKQALLFTPFVQADSDVTRKFGGTGLGLSICQEIIHAMGGNIFLESTEHIGSVFYFTLIFKQADLEYKNAERRKNVRMVNAAEDRRFDSLSVLIVEDNLVNIKVLSAQLNRLNIDADIAYDGQQAFEMHEKSSYDIIVSDCHMPVLDGFGLAKKLASLADKKPYWLIAITADALSGTAEKCIAAGFDDYMAKPCQQKTITDKLNNAYRQLKLKQELVPHTFKATENYRLFDPQKLLKINHLDLMLSAHIAQLFVDSYQQETQSLANALEGEDFTSFYAIIHKVRGSIRYLSRIELDASAQQVEHHALIQNKLAAQASLNEFLIQLSQLNIEIKHWLANTRNE